MALTYFAPTLSIVLDTARACGVDPTPLLHKWAIDPRRLSDPRARLRLSQVFGLFADLDRALPPAGGLKAGAFWHPNRFGVLGYAWLTSPSLRTAFKRLSRYSRIVSEGARVTVEDGGDQVTLRVLFREPDCAPWLRMDATLAVLLAMVQSSAGADSRPQRVAVAHPPPADTGPYHALFQCPVEFDAPVCAFTVTAEMADAPRTPSPEALDALHERAMLEYLAQLREDDVIERVKAVLYRELPSGQLSDAYVARQLFMHPRTLQRRLQAAGTTYKSILTEVRRTLADRYLREGRYTLSEISFLLGFSELSAFSRAFKRWTGQPPRGYRQEQLEGLSRRAAS